LSDEFGLCDHLAAAPAHLAHAVVSDLTGDSESAHEHLEMAVRPAEVVSARNFLRLCDAVGATFTLPPDVVRNDMAPSAELPDLPFMTRLARPAQARRLASIGAGPDAERLLRSVEPHELTLAAWIELGLDRVPMHDLNRWVQRRPETTCVRGAIVHMLALAATSEHDAVMVEHCRRAADLAMPGHLVGVFLDAPRQLLDRLVTQLVDHPLLAEVSHGLVVAARPVRLTPRELQLLTLLAGPEQAAEIAERLCVSLSTVKTHIASVYRKLDVANRAAAVARGRELGLIPGTPGR
jgi:DNA-binding CsgD family transcriptional regulator